MENNAIHYHSQAAQKVKERDRVTGGQDNLEQWKKSGLPSTRGNMGWGWV